MSSILKKRVIEIFKFGLVGCSGLVIDFSVTYFFKENMEVNRYVANIMGFSLAVVNNYMVNRFWTFKGKDAKVPYQAVRFLLVSLIGLGLNTLCIYLLQLMGCRFYPAKAIAIVLVFIWNYSTNALITFKKTDESPKQL